MGVDSKGIEIRQYMEIFMSEQSTSPTIRIDYGEEKYISNVDSVGLLPVHVKAMKSPDGKALVSAEWGSDYETRSSPLKWGAEYREVSPQFDDVEGMGKLGSRVTGMWIAHVDSEGVELRDKAGNARKIKYGDTLTVGEDFYRMLTTFEKGFTPGTALWRIDNPMYAFGAKGLNRLLALGD